MTMRRRFFRSLLRRWPLPLLVMLAVAMVPPAAVGRTRTTRGQLRPAGTSLAVLPPADSTAADTVVNQNAVELRGYSKRLSDSRESFSVTNHLPHRISGLRLLLRYTRLDGTMIHEREAAVEVRLDPGQTKVVSIPSFDRAHLYYYHRERAPRKQSAPYEVSYRLLGYDIPVGR